MPRSIRSREEKPAERQVTGLVGLAKRPLTRQSVNYLIAMAAERAGLSPVHPHMLRHSCGFYLANRGYDLRLIRGLRGPLFHSRP